MELIIGSHVSFKGDTQLVGSLKEMLSYDANACMIYTGAPQNTNRSEININLLLEAGQIMKEYGIDSNNIAAHAPYIINPSNNSDLKKYKFTIDFLRNEIDRCEMLGINKLVLHPGSHVGLGAEVGIRNTINVLNEVLTEEDDIIICVESMAGKGSEVGKNIDELKIIVDGVKLKDKVGICLDTCHLSDSGVDLSKFDEYLDEFDKKIGIDKIKVFHINDSKNVRGAGKDRHENLGFGELGFDTLIDIIYNKRLESVPKILETPYVSLENNGKDRSIAPYKHEIMMIKDKKFNQNLLDDIRNDK